MIRLTGIVFSVCLALFCTGQDSSQEAKEVKQKSTIHWLTFEEAFEKHQKEPRLWMIDISTNWCGWCKRMDATTFSDSIVVPFVNAHYYAVALDGEFKEDIVLEGRTYSFISSGKRGYHELPAELMSGKMSYPTVVFLSEKLENLSPLSGYRSAEDFYPILKFFTAWSANHSLKWEEFLEGYVSPFGSRE